MEKKELKKMIILINVLFLLTSCNNDKIEISNIDFPVKTEIFLKNVKYDEDKNIYREGLLTYEVEQLNAYKFFDESFDGEIIPNSATYSGKNYLQFIGDKDHISGFQLHLWTKNESEKLLKALMKNLGKTNFEDDKGFEKYFIWESSNKIYILNQGYDAIIQDKKTIESDLLCLDTNNLGDVAVSASSNTKYSNYLEYRLKIKKNIITYPYSAYLKEKK